MWGLTPRHLFRQPEPSWFRRGQTTSLLVSATEKEPVREVRGGMALLLDAGSLASKSTAARAGWGEEAEAGGSGAGAGTGTVLKLIRAGGAECCC